MSGGQDAQVAMATEKPEGPKSAAEAAEVKAAAKPAEQAGAPVAEEAAEEGGAEAKRAPRSGGFKAFSSMLARNFYVLKTIGLTLAFVINIFMLFYKAQVKARRYSKRMRVKYKCPDVWRVCTDEKTTFIRNINMLRSLLNMLR